MELLLEARAIFLADHFYSCVAMCGIVGERLVKDVFRASVLVLKEGRPQSPPNVALDQFERVEVSGIVRFLGKAELLGATAAKAAADLGDLRNKYAHARGKKPQDDALEGIKLLHILVEGTVSVYKDFEIKDGALVRNASKSES